MKFHVLAVDYDGTLADNGFVDPATVEALLRLRQSGRRLILVTGRLLQSLLKAFPEVAVCDLVVAENGALLYNPDTRKERPLAEPPPREFVEKLAARDAAPDEVGHVIVATHVPNETLVLETIRDMSLERQIIFNKGAVMVLPTGVNKATGLEAALTELGYSRHNAVGVGDAENDEAFMKHCAASAAVANALDPLKIAADIVLRSAASRGVVEVIDKLLADDLQELHEVVGRGILLGVDADGDEVRLPVYRPRILLTGQSAGGKSKLAVSILGELMAADYQACVIDPEGDFQAIEDAVVLGTTERTPSPDEVMQVIRKPDKSCVVSLFAAGAEDQPGELAGLFRVLQDHRARTGRPHLAIIDEAHYPVSPGWKPLDELQLEDWSSIVYVTAYPERLHPDVLAAVDYVVAVGEDPAAQLQAFCGLVSDPFPNFKRPADESSGRALVWRRGEHAPTFFEPPDARGEHRRHRHQYLEGEMAPEDRFYFRGPEDELNLAAGNLSTFMDLAEGVDDDTWTYHLRRGDYAQWFRDSVHDEELAVVAERLKGDDGLSPDESRRKISEMIQRLYVTGL